jgi:hypothetical protein
MNLFLADMLGTTWFIGLAMGISFIAGISMANKIKNWIFKR